MESADYRGLAERSWTWVLSQVKDHDGPWVPHSPEERVAALAPPDEVTRDSIYMGAGGLAFVLAEIRLRRPWVDDEATLADGLSRRALRSSSLRSEPGLYLGLSGNAAVLRVLGHTSEATEVMERLVALRAPDGWVAQLRPGESEVVVHDLLAGAAGVALTGVWCGGAEGAALARTAASGLAADADVVGDGLDWPMYVGQKVRLPNYSHGTAGISAALAITAAEVGDEALLDAAVRGAAHVVSLADLSEDGFRVPHYVAPVVDIDEDRYAYSWCHGPTGTVHLFDALAYAGVEEIAGHQVTDLRARCLRSVLDSGVPERLRPGFWDNDGQCCGTAGVGEVFLDAAQRAAADGTGSADGYLAAAIKMGDALVDRAIVDDTGARWRFIEHRAEAPLLPPKTGWSQGAAGISSYLMRLSRVLDEGLEAPTVDRPDQWWSVPRAVRTVRV